MTDHYYPDNWVVIKITENEETLYKVIAGWSGGYATGDSWRMNSGITKVEEDTDSWGFYGHSGSCYVCYKDHYGLRMNNAGIYNRLVKAFPDTVEMMDKNTDWSKLV